MIIRLRRDKWQKVLLVSQETFGNLLSSHFSAYLTANHNLGDALMKSGRSYTRNMDWYILFDKVKYSDEDNVDNREYDQ